MSGIHPQSFLLTAILPPSPFGIIEAPSFPLGGGSWVALEAPGQHMTIVDNNSVQTPYQVDKLSCMVNNVPKTTIAPLRSDCRKTLPYILICRIRVSGTIPLRSQWDRRRCFNYSKLEEYTTPSSVVYMPT